MIQKHQKGKKHFTSSDRNKFTNNILDAKVTGKK